MRTERMIGGKACYIYDCCGAADTALASGDAVTASGEVMTASGEVMTASGGAMTATGVPLLIQPVDEYSLEYLDKEVAEIERLINDAGSRDVESGVRAFRLAAFRVRNWNSDLSPWEAPPTFGDEPFGGGAAETLSYIENELLPALLDEEDGDSAVHATRDSAPVILGGYSLAGLFALWAGTVSKRFSGIAAASPSVWFPGWIEYAERYWSQSAGKDMAELQDGLQRVYLSLGDKEERTRNPQMRKVGDCIRRQDEIFTAVNEVRRENGVKELEHTLVWEQGNHFREPELRTARAFAWVLRDVFGTP